ncbi:hypothetical protein EZI54_11515 [Marinobacter halodurans]|uniref:Uncharacterized protein n=1 Tax=Marinobacter halodurans TaxID=2528979 RepID=A0ABY1ZNX5_9GAMM|nr:hypothetical protein [Marinobacter halodurans]TBW55448.1 hypothetical protein EZI54_11515 [Marinobacter halodurans]
MSTLEAFLESREKDGVWAFNRRWRDCPFYGIYLRREEGTEIPSLISDDDFQMMTAGPDRQEVEDSIKEWQPPEGTRIVIKEKPFHAWCRDCLHNGVLLNWLGEGAVMNQTILHLMGYTAVRDGADGRPFLTECTPLKTDEDTSRFKAQKWLQAGIDPDLKKRDESVDESLVYDSTKDTLFTNANLEQRCRETLSTVEQALYDEWSEMPVDFAELLGVDPKTVRRDVSDVETELNFQLGEHEPIAPEGTPESIDKLLKLEKAIAEKVLGQEAGLRLEVEPYDPPESIDKEHPDIDKPQSGPESSDGATGLGAQVAEGEPIAFSNVNVVFGNYPQYALNTSGVLVQDSDLKAAALPVQPGNHPFPPGFYQTLARHLACVLHWYGVVQAEALSFSNVEDTMRGLFPSRVLNLDKTYIPDYEDNNYPRYGRWRLTSGEVPLLLLGEEDGHHICLFMLEVEVPADDIPATFPDRHEIIDQGRARFLDFLDFIAIPKNLVDYPDEWLRKSGPSNDKFVYEMKRELQIVFLARSPKGQREFSIQVAQRAMSGIEAEYRDNDTSNASEGDGAAAAFIFFLFIAIGLAFWFG